MSEAGIELLSFQRTWDSMTFFGAKTLSAAQTVMADLSLKNGLWHELNNRGQAVPGLLAQAMG